MSGIVGTAGHIDHGKSALVTRLTGVDPDRLPEEKRRGITLTLGFAPLELPEGRRAAVVDVPGHERFVRTMVAGATGIDVALVVVAADEGVMPQTREHLEILELLGIPRGVVALNKVDKAGADLTQLAADELAEVLQGTFLEGAPIVPCSARTGYGVEDLRAALGRSLADLPRRRASTGFFLPIDRAFTVRGFGTVVTGTACSGSVAIGDELELSPPLTGRRPPRARVRSLQEFGREATTLDAGRRVALALAGLELAEVHVGQVLARPGAAVPTQRLTARVQHLASRTRGLRSGAKVSLHLGTSVVPASVTPFGGGGLGPGEVGLVTLRVARPVACLPGQRFILRGFDAAGPSGRTLGGGVVLDPEPPRRRRRSEAALRVVSALDALQAARDATGRDPRASGLLEGALVALVDEGGPGGLSIDDAARRLGESRGAVERAAAGAAAFERIRGMDGLVGAAALERLEPRVLAAVGRFHAEQPLAASIAPAELASRVGRGLPAGIVDRAVGRLVRAGRLLAVAGGVRDASHAPPSGDLREGVRAAIEAAGLEPPTGDELAERLSISPALVRAALSALVRERAIVLAGKGLYFGRSPFEAAQRRLLEVIETEGPLSTARAKAILGVSRKFLIPLLETFDRLGVTIREGEARRAARPLPREPEVPTDS